jgi:hypothetical protein
MADRRFCCYSLEWGWDFCRISSSGWHWCSWSPGFQTHPEEQSCRKQMAWAVPGPTLRPGCFVLVTTTSGSLSHISSLLGTFLVETNLLHWSRDSGDVIPSVSLGGLELLEGWEELKSEQKRPTLKWSSIWTQSIQHVLFVSISLTLMKSH